MTRALLLGLVLMSNKGLKPQWVEKDAAQYAGEYVLHEADPKDPYRFTVSKIALKHTPKGWTATYTTGVQRDGDDLSKHSADLKNVKVEGGAFSADPVAERKKWPGYVPFDGFHGLFAIESPPDNAKGPVHHGLELTPDRKFFRRLGP